MDKFYYDESGQLHCEGVAVEKIIEKVGTPFYLYSINSLRDHFQRFHKAFESLNPLICFSLKSLNNLELIKELVALGSGVDTVSGGELYLSKASGVDMSKVVYAGIGKTDAEISMAIDWQIGLINVESEQEFENISRIAKEKQKPIKAALRVTPDVIDARTHDYTKTGYRGSKFGVDIERAKQFFSTYGQDEFVKLEGIHIHIGSPTYSAEPYVKAIQRVIDLVDYLTEQGHEISVLDIGGGYAADYNSGDSLSWQDYADSIIPLLLPYVNKGVQIVMEPGRTLAANSGILVGSVNYVKKGGDKTFAILDTGMHHLIRPSLYQASHFIWPVKTDIIPEHRLIGEKREGLVPYDVVGPICESADFLAKDRYLPPLERGDHLAVFTSGAYGMVMSSQYNAMPRPAEIMIDQDKVIVIRKRESYEDLISHIDNIEV
ncbi:MAG: diaminopimelate decarboxylase [Bacteroidota bacterium]